MNSSHIQIANHNLHSFFTVRQAAEGFFMVNTNPLAPMTDKRLLLFGFAQN